MSGPLAQLVFARDGTVYLVAAGRVYHAGVVTSSLYQNSHRIGIEAEATGVSSWPKAQVNAYAKLCRALIKDFDLPRFSCRRTQREVLTPRSQDRLEFRHGPVPQKGQRGQRRSVDRFHRRLEAV